MSPKRAGHATPSIVVAALLFGGLHLLPGGTSQVVRRTAADLFVSPSGSGSACTRTQPCGLQTALDEASDGATIYLAAGLYTGSGDAVVTMSNSVALYGGWDGAASGALVRDPDVHQTILDGEGARRVVSISGEIAPVLDGLTIQGGNATGLGGYGTSDAGGGVYIEGSTALIGHCTVRDSQAGPASTTGNGTGGGLVLIHSNARIENSLIISNTARWGGGVRVISGAPTFRGNHFLSNTSVFGGGMYLMYGTARVEDNLFEGNAGSLRGGAIYLSGADASLLGNVIRGNQGGSGGGIGINTGTSVAIRSNLILDNSADNLGGGLYISQIETDLRNNVIADNEARSGAGVYAEKATCSFRHNTIARNGSGDGEGLFVAEGAEARLTNTIVVGHAVGVEASAGSTATLQATLWGSGAWSNADDWGGEGTVDSGTVNVWGAPAFVGADAGDYHIGAGSAAIDAGVNAGVTTDMDGNMRPLGSGFDIGADEFGQATPTATPTRQPLTVTPRQYLPMIMSRT
jgi:fibronectin-binding autotransporter adhesin